MISEQEILDASILIVDDQEANVQLLEQMLRDVGYTRITSTTDPHAVGELHRTKRYDLILLDLMMPGMDGFQVMEGLKKFETKGYLPVLVLTAQPDHKLRALAAGAKDFVAKPFDLVEVKTRIRNLLEVRLLYKKLEHHNQVLEQTVQKRTAELRESEARFRRLTELATDWYWEQDASGHFTKVYGPVLEMLGVLAANLPVKVDQEQVTHWNEAERTVLKETMAARQPFLDFVLSRQSINGKREYYQVSGEPVFDSAGGFIGYRGVGREVTEIILNSAQPEAA